MNLESWLKRSSQAADIKRLALPIELEDGAAARMNQRVLMGSLIGVCGFVVWSYLTPVRELALASGEIIPRGQVRSIQHLEGGVVEDIRAADGDEVRAGQVILRLAPAMAEADQGQLRIRRASLSQQSAQIAALLEGGTPALDANAPLLAEQKRVFELRGLMRAAERASLTSRIEQRRESLRGAEAEVDGVKRQMVISREQLEIRVKLEAQGYTSRRAVLEARAVYEQHQLQLVAAQSRAASARQAITEAESELARVTADARRLLSEEASRVRAELGEVEEMIAKASDRVERLTVRAPVDGIVLQIMPRSKGEVIRPGEPVARFVPASDRLVAEVRVKPADIGHIKVGDRAEIKVSTFDPRNFGKLQGEVLSLSASSLLNERGEPYFKATVTFPETSLQGMGRKVALAPGMTVDAEIITGAKSLFAYMLKPFQAAVSTAFSER